MSFITEEIEMAGKAHKISVLFDTAPDSIDEFIKDWCGGDCEKIYHGYLKGGDMDWAVEVNGKDLPPRLDLVNHSPTGFAWGYGGSGPAQLALAILADYTGNKHVALKNYQRLKWKVLSKIPTNNEWYMVLRVEK